ncbi:hypothetical protein FKM82_022575 [Ascaphus truei]
MPIKRLIGRYRGHNSGQLAGRREAGQPEEQVSRSALRSALLISPKRCPLHVMRRTACTAYTVHEILNPFFSLDSNLNDLLIGL